jgi:hypothetical protein
MSTYKQATKVASPKVGQADVDAQLREEISSGNVRSGPFKGTKTSGIVTRGNGCATRGKTARGPMA